MNPFLEKAAEIAKAKTGLDSLAQMVGIKSLKNGVDTENKTVQAWQKAEHRHLWDCDMPDFTKEDIEMMAAGDININLPPRSVPPSGGLSWLKVLTIAAAIVAAGWLLSGNELPEVFQGLEFPGQGPQDGGDQQ